MDTPKTFKTCIISVITSIVIALFTISASVSLPILIRPFYYMQISSLNLEERTGYSYETIRRAFDEMSDYCIGITNDFGTGELAWSQNGRSHFTDVRGLFLLDIYVLTGSSIILIIMILLHKYRRLCRPYHFLGHTPAFYSGTGLLALFAVIGALAASDFDRAFVIFHHIFFPGKDNWIFDADTDQIILILPEEFFAGCGILILASIILMCIIYIIHSIAKRPAAGCRARHNLS